MGSAIGYLRAHPWQRRVLTFGVAVVLGLLAAGLTYDTVVERSAIRSLASRDPHRRQLAVARAAALARRRPSFVRRLEETLGSDDDGLFLAAVAVLRRIGKFDTAWRDPVCIDRMRALQIAETRSVAGAAETRRLLLAEVLAAGRDNRYVRAALARTARDEATEVRRLAARLAARLGDDRMLAALLQDGQGEVAAAAALDAGLAGRAGLSRRLAGLLDGSEDVEVISSAAYGLALLAPADYSRRICRLALEAKLPAVRDRLLHVLTVLADDDAAATVGRVLSAAVDGGQLPPAAAIAAGSRLRVSRMPEVVKAVIDQAVRGSGEVRQSQVAAAFDAAVAMRLDVHDPAERFCRRYWGPGLPLVLMAAAGATVPPGGGRDGRRQGLVRTLRRAAEYHRPAARQPATGPAEWISTPMPSAAAAAALWKLSPADAQPCVRQLASVDPTLPGDYLAWHLARSDRAAAFGLGLVMLPPPAGAGRLSQPRHDPVYNENQLATGAMLLALSAGPAEQVAEATGRIEARLAGLARGGRDGLLLRGTYQCALLMLGRADVKPAVRELLTVGQFPQRRALTALLVVGDGYALDWLLSPQNSDDYVAFVLVNEALAEVLAACAPSLPTVDAFATGETLLWRVRIVREAWAVGRGHVKLGLARPGETER